MSIRKLIIVSIVTFFTLSNVAFGQNNQIVAGAGPSTEICKKFFNSFNKLKDVKSYNFAVMEGSVKHKGGILNSDKFIFGRTGRPLTEAEKALGKEEIFLAKVPIAFAKGLNVSVSTLDMDQIRKIFLGEITNWKQIGGDDAAITLVGRESTEALFMSLKEEYPYFKDVAFEKVFKKDHEVVSFLTSPSGKNAIAFGAKPNFSEHNLLNVEGFSSGVKVGLVYDLKNAQSPIVKLAKDFAISPDWKKEVSKTSMLNID